MTTWRANCALGCTYEQVTGVKRPKVCDCGTVFVSDKARSPSTSPSKTQAPRKALKRTQRRESAPRWLTQGFADGVDERSVVEALEERQAFDCWLAQFDPLERPCSYKLERFHYISRQRVEHALYALLLIDEGTFDYDALWRAELIQIAAWDPRNGGVGCEEHHRRLDSHATPRLIVPAPALPSHVVEFVQDWGLEIEAERKFGELAAHLIAAADEIERH